MSTRRGSNTRIPIGIAAEIILRSAARPRNAGPRVIGIDGPDCAGKSTLAAALRGASDEDTLIVHGDDFLYPDDVRAGKGGFDVATLMCDYFDWPKWEAAVAEALQRAPGLVVIEGVFLAASPVVRFVSEKVWIDLPPSQVLERAIKRDVDVIGDHGWVERHYREQCLPAQRIYQRYFRPQDSTDWLLDASGGDHHVLVVRGPE